MRNRSFGNLLQTMDDSIEEDNFLFTKLVNKKCQHSLPNDQEIEQLNEILTKFELLKLEKANEIANKHLKSGKPIDQILHEVVDSIDSDIYKIIQYWKKEGSLKNSTYMHSTMENTSSYDPSLLNSFRHEQNEKLERTVEFTWGNKESGKSNSGRENRLEESRGGNVSDFSAKISSTRSIKQKLTGIH